jgi:hypothetical protein
MKPFSIRVNRIIDAGTIVSLIGVEADTRNPVTVHVDYRPFDVVWAAWRDIGTTQPIEYAAAGLTLSLGLPADRTEGDPHRGAEPAKPTQPNRFRQALQIVDPGASNPNGIAQAIVAACAEIRSEGGSITRDPAVRLMVTQLAWVCRAVSEIDDYDQWLAECRRRRAAEPAS